MCPTNLSLKEKAQILACRAENVSTQEIFEENRTRQPRNLDRFSLLYTE